MSKPTLRLALIGLLWLGWLFTSETFADYYKYTDSKGVVTITNKLDSVPQKYRAKMTVVREAPKKEAAVPAPEPSAQGAALEPQHEDVAASQESAGMFALLSSRFPWFKPLAYVVGIAALFLAVTKVAALLPSPMLSRAIYISFFLGVMVFLYKSYVENVARSTAKIKDSAVAIIKNSSAREESATGGGETAADK